MILEYLKIARSFNAALTGLAPVMGALATGQYQIGSLFLLFLIGVFGHAYGFTHNDIIDYSLDKNEKEIKDRPLISGTITKRNAWIFAMGSLCVVFILALFLSFSTNQYLPVFILFIPILCVTLYNLTSKKIVFADILLGIGMFFFIFYGAIAQGTPVDKLPILVWVICLLGAIQVLFMNIVEGGFKDIGNDARQKAHTVAVRLGLRVIETKIHVPLRFKFIAYTLQITNILFAYLPFLIIPNFKIRSTLVIFQLISITLISILMLNYAQKYLNLIQFERGKIRKLIGIHYYLNFLLAPILLLTITPYAILIVFIPGIGFIISNLILHEKLMEPSVM